MNPDLHIYGVVATLYEMVVKDHNEILEMLKKKYNVIGTTKKQLLPQKGYMMGNVWSKEIQSLRSQKSMSKLQTLLWREIKI